VEVYRGVRGTVSFRAIDTRYGDIFTGNKGILNLLNRIFRHATFSNQFFRVLECR
jgi:hypothetical protein